MRFIAVLAVAAICAASFADQSKELKSYVVSMAPKLTAAYKTKDSTFFEKLYPPTFKIKDARGVTQGKKASIFLIRYRFNSMMKVLSFNENVVSVKADGGKGTVTTKCVMTGLLNARGGAKPQSVEIVRLLQDHYVKVGNSWQPDVEQDVKDPIVKIDGKVPMGFATMGTVKPAAKH